MAAPALVPTIREAVRPVLVHEVAGHVPSASYRLQFRPGFGFAAARRLVPFLRGLGVSHIYASPIFAARKGSTHGYDVTDPLRLNPELGTAEEFDALAHDLKRHGMGLILDIVPNHMAACTENPWWEDVLANGRESRFAGFFDIDWEAAGGRIVLPVLGAPFAEVLKNGELRVARDERGFHLRYWEHRFPLAPGSYNSGSPEPLGRVISQQNYILAYWRTGRERINYRRFFDINELVALRVEDEEVFRATHALIFRLVREGKIAGLRLDHLDGLHDPAAYLRRLQRSLGPDVYIIAEKITIGGERLRQDWPVCGTTGYDFLNAANAVFVDGLNLRRLAETYARFTGVRQSFGELVYEQKKRVMRELFATELRRLSLRLQALGGGHPSDCQAAIEEVTARLPVYRTYIRSLDVAPADREAIESACELASDCPPTEFLRRVLLLECPREEWLDFVMRWQQFTGPAMAKGMEDTACYIYNRLVSLNVVGGDCEAVSVERFHRFNQVRRRVWPFSFNATSTHDTKRSEDVRARINVLSEVPDLWQGCLERWSRWNQGSKRLVNGAPAPSANDEILLYQVLVGAWPLAEAEVSEFQQRLEAFAIKAAREAKLHTDWLTPHAEYERALVDFCRAILEPRPDNLFLPDFRQFQQRIARFGAIGSLAQVLLKTTCPGVPDFYQGTLLWDFSLVDPDNRRPVDFARRMELMRELPAWEVEDLLANWTDGRIKLYTVAKALDFRRAHRRLFLSGEYVPLSVRGPAAAHLIAFARRTGSEWALVAVPRLVAALSRGNSDLWRDTEICLPEQAPGWWHNVFTAEVTGTARPLSVSRLLGRYPVALLSGAGG